jgi:ribose/xylose/arabinose/galactoside ABC-type transport system permease subunit
MAAEAANDVKIRRASPTLVDFIARYGILLVLVLLIAALSIITPLVRGEQYFLRIDNLFNVLLQASINAIIAVGMTFIITSGGIDLSVGSMVALAGVIAAWVMRESNTALGAAFPEGSFLAGVVGPGIALLGFLVCVVVGTLCGLLNGVLITRVGLQPFIATLGTMSIFRGLALVFTGGEPIYGFGRDFLQIFSGRIFNTIPTQVIFAVVAAVIFWFVLNLTRFGKYTIAIGGNEETTRLAGINVNRYKLGIYALGGMLTGMAGALLLARLSSGDPTFGRLFELDAIAAVVMGGTSLTGGEGTIAGTMVGALIISLVRNGLNLMNVPSFWQEVVIGSVIVLAVMLDQWRKRQSRRE